MHTSTIWISYDLGVTGDYDGLYAWLDNHSAKECGHGVAYLKVDHSDDLLDYLKTEINEFVSIDKRSRIYVIRREGDKMRGRYLIGRRKAAPWTGFGTNDDNEEDGE